MNELDEIFELQFALQHRLKRPVHKAHTLLDQAKKGDLYARTQLWDMIRADVEAMRQELAELTDCFPWKHWRKVSDQPFDVQNARVEVVDIMHFLVNIALYLGMDANDLHAAFMAKNQVNHERQDSGYVAKNEDDCRHICPVGADK